MTLSEVARGWIGTPFVAGQSVQGQGCDCLGLLCGVLGWPMPIYGPQWQLTQGAEALEKGLTQLCMPCEGPLRENEIWLFALLPRGAGCHIGISSQAGRTFLHAYSGLGVVESCLTEPWRRRLVRRFSPI